MSDGLDFNTSKKDALGSAAGNPVLIVKQMLAGSLARATATTIMVPVDTIKTRLQFQGALSSDLVRRYDGLWDAFVGILKEEGIRGFYRGLPARLLYVGPAAGVSFGLYEWFKRALLKVREGSGDKFEPLVPLIAGSSARLFGSGFKIPFDVVKQRMEVQGVIKVKTEANVYKGTFDAFRKILRNEGLVGGLWSGFFVTLLRDVPFAATYFTTYELGKHIQTKIFVSPTPDSARLKTINHLVAGAFAGVIASVVTIPVDAIKTRIQTDALIDRQKKRDQGITTPKGASGPYKRAGISSTAKMIYTEEGWRGFYKGLLPRLASVVPSSSITFAVYEIYKRVLDV